jgi:LysW-gamma-L-lysine carboxypeptidase
MQDADALLVGLVEWYSPSTQERPAVEYLVGQMSALGFRAYVDGAGNAVGELGDGERVILLLGHIDTVPGVIPVRREGDLLYGRGAVDAKGPLATFVAAAARAGAQPGKRIIVVGAVEEEAATSKGARFLLDKLAPEAVVIGEPSAWDRLTVAYKGRLLVDYTLAREIGHTARPDGSACEDACAFWQAAQDYAAAAKCLAPAHVSTSSRPPYGGCTPRRRLRRETARLTVAFRLPPDCDAPDALQATLRAAAGGRRPALLRPRNRLPRLQATSRPRFLKAISEEGGEAQFKVKSGTSDMNVVGPVWQCPISPTALATPRSITRPTNTSIFPNTIAPSPCWRGCCKICDVKRQTSNHDV